MLASVELGTISARHVAECGHDSAQFTIPLMKRNGYRPHFRGLQLKACRSSGGSSLRLLMGATAFVDRLNSVGRPYQEIAR